MKGYILRGDRESQKYIVQANLSFLDLIKHAQFTQMTDINSNPYTSDKNETDEYYQRRVEPNRVTKIQKYIRDIILSKDSVSKAVALFPTTLLLAANWERAYTETQICEMDAFYEEISSLYIVDGQHRLYSMRELYNEAKISSDADNKKIVDYLQNYYFNCTILVNFDMWEQAQIFADVNFNQKKVNKSIYYSIYGMKQPNKDDLTTTSIYMAHQLTRLMNIYDDSPLYRNIKMLGTGSGYISQSFFADAIIRNFQPRGIWYKADCVYQQAEFQRMAKELLSFFTAVKNVFSDIWPGDDGQHKSIITKTTGIGALIRLMAYLHLNFLPQNIQNILQDSTSDKIVKEYVDCVTKYLKYISISVFSFDGKFANTGGKGIEVKLFDALVYEITKSVSDCRAIDIDNDSSSVEESTTNQNEWLDLLDLEDYEDVDALYNSVDSEMRYGVFNTERDGDDYIISSDLMDIKLRVETEQDKKDLLRLIEKKYCDDMPEAAWYGYQYAISKDD